MALIPATKKQKGGGWVVEYLDTNNEPKDLIIRSTEAELDEIINTVQLDDNGEQRKDGDGNIMTMIYPFNIT